MYKTKEAAAAQARDAIPVPLSAVAGLLARQARDALGQTVNARICGACHQPYHGPVLFPRDCARAALASERGGEHREDCPCSCHGYSPPADCIVCEPIDDP
jgi:hypothetical protein